MTEQERMKQGYIWEDDEENLALQAKCKALSMYRGVMRPYPHPRSTEYITGLAAVRGGQWGVNYAEAFEVVQREY